MRKKIIDADSSIHLNINAPSIIAAGISDKGCVRVANEDNIWIDKSGKVLLLADGMGGHERGADASRIAIEIFSDQLSPDVIKAQLNEITAVSGVPSKYASLYTIVFRAVRKAAKTICEKNRELKLERYMGTTIVGLLMKEEKLFWFNIGDSRIYSLRDSRLMCITADHSAYAEWQEAGAIGPAPGKNLITRAIGNDPEVEADIEYDEKKSNDIYLLCSDGLTDIVSDEKIEEILKGSHDIPGKANLLVNEALSAGGRDNISVIVCKTI